MPTNPTAGDLHVNRPLTTFAQNYIQDRSLFTLWEAFPNLPVEKQSDLYFVYDKDDLFRVDAKPRADGTESQGGSFTLSTQPYFANVYAWHKDVTDRQRANTDNPIGIDRAASEYVANQLFLHREKFISDKVLNVSNWGGNDNKDWTNGGSATSPIADVRSAKRAVQQKTGHIPNKILMGRLAYDTLLDNEEVLARISGGATTSLPAMVMRQMLAQLLEVESIFVIDAVYNSAAKGATANMGFVASDDVLVYYAPNSISVSGEPTAAVNFSWSGFLGATDSGLRIKRFRMENIESDRIEGQMAYDFKITGPDLGHMFTSVAAS